ncbi:hypothetical protein A2U01_0026337, partial [Trifolium medium]|nr:hypothetical protein [Trifolium medium]
PPVKVKGLKGVDPRACDGPFPTYGANVLIRPKVHISERLWTLLAISRICGLDVKSEYWRRLWKTYPHMLVDRHPLAP